MREQFDSCSYQELTYCAKARIAWLREYRKFRKDDAVKAAYPLVSGGLLMKAVIEKGEVKRLLKMRRVLRKSGLKNWDHRRLTEWGRIDIEEKP